VRGDLANRIEYMVNHGSSLTVNWGEDNGCYEVDWITGGERFRGVSRNLLDAMQQAVDAAERRFGTVAMTGIS
jgi:hypothetical protein